MKYSNRLLVAAAALVALLPTPHLSAQQCPTVVDVIDYGQTGTVAAAGNLVVANSETFLMVLNASEPGNLLHAGEVDLGQSIKAVAVSGTTALAILSGEVVDSIAFVDISNPNLPVLLATQTDGLPPFLADLAILGASVYVAAGGYGITAYSLTTDPSLVFEAELDSYANWVTVDPATGLVFLPNGTRTRIVDFSDPLNVQIIAELEPAEEDVFFEGNVDLLGSLALCPTEEGIDIWDVSTPGTPVFQSSISTTNRAMAVGSISPTTLFSIDMDRQLVAYDLSDPTSPSFIDSDNTLPLGSRFVTVGDRVFLAARDQGVAEISVAAGSSSLVVDGRVTKGGSSEDVAMVGATVYSVNTKLWILEASETGGLTSLGSEPGHGRLTSVAVDGGIAIASAKFNKTVNSFDVSDPSEPEHIYSRTNMGEDSIGLRGTSAIITDSLYGVSGFAVQPNGWIEQRSIISELTSSSRAIFDPDSSLVLTEAMAAWPMDDYFFVLEPPASGNSFIELGRAPAIEYLDCDDAVAAGGVAYFACEEEVIALDFVDPENPITSTVIEAWAADPDFHFSGVVIADGLLVASTMFHGLRVYDLSQPMAPRLVGSAEEVTRITSLGSDTGPLFVAGSWVHGPTLLTVAGCPTGPPEIFADGFESGDTTQWSTTGRVVAR